MDECVFCKIVEKKVPSQIEKETENLIVIKDINPAAPIHLLIVPKKHLRDITEDSGASWSAIGTMASSLAKEKGLNGFRLVHNAGDAAEVAHMHVHFLGEISKDRKI